MNRIDRLTGIILLLQGQRVITAEQIAEHYEISVRTVYRDLSALGEAGVPIIAEAGVGYSLMRGYHMPPVMFTADEAAALFISGQLAEQGADDSLRNSLRSALLKVSSVLPQEKKDYLHRMKDTVGISLRKVSGDDRRESLMPIQDAVVKRLCLEIEYNTANRGALSRRVVEPLGMVFYSRQWHLIAWCRLRGDFRHFRLDRMPSWAVLDEQYEGHRDFSVRQFLGETLSQCELFPATIRIREASLERFRAELPCTLLKEEREPDGWARIELLTFSLEWLAEWLLGFGNKVEVLEPEELRRAVRDSAMMVVARYAEEFQPA